MKFQHFLFHLEQQMSQESIDINGQFLQGNAYYFLLHNHSNNCNTRQVLKPYHVLKHHVRSFTHNTLNPSSHLHKHGCAIPTLDVGKDAQ